MARIGVIDSGYGGLSFIQAYAKIGVQNHTMIYAGDNSRAPYGVRDIETLYQFATDLIDYLICTHSVEMIVIACGTIATNILPQLQAHYTLPIYGISQQLFEKEMIWQAPVGVIATEKTVSSQYFQKRFGQLEIESTVIPTQCFVDMVEGVRASDEEQIKEVLLPVANCSMLILGCTHFPFLASSIQRCLPKVQLIDPAMALIQVVDNLQSEEKRSFLYVTSGDTGQFQQFLIQNNLPKGEVQYENFARIK